MKARALPSLLVALTLAACERESQALPLDADATTATRTVSSAGGIVSLPGAVALHFPAGALAGSSEVTLQLTDAPAAGSSGGRLASAWYRAEPAGLVLGRPALAELKFDPQVERERAWLASVVVATAGGAREIGETRVDLATAIARADIPALGSVAVVIPEADAVFPVLATGATAPAGGPSSIARRVGADSVAIECGGPANRCAGIAIRASRNLLDRVERAAVVFPSIRGGLKFDARTSTLRGRIAVDATVRALLGSGTTTANVAVDVEDFRIDQRVALPLTLDAPRASGVLASAAATSIVVTVTDTVSIVNAAGDSESATISISFPVQLF